MRLVRPLQETEGQLFGLVVQLINGVSKLRIAAAEERAFAYWGRSYSRQQKLKQAIQKNQDRVRIFNLVLPALSSALIFWMVEEILGVTSPVSGGMALGTFLAFNAAFGVFFGGATSLSDTGLGLLNVANLWKRARVILDAPPEVDVTKMHPGKMTGRVSMENVTFRYRDDGPLILDDVTIEAAPGECVALVGPSGSGKSTILNLLLRFEVPLSGAIYYDGQNLNSLDVAAVRRQLGVVLQENRIMAGSIYDNIVCGSLCTLEEAWDAARAAAFDADIETMPMKMHTPISEGGSNISGGQRQRLLIARALVSKPSILIFDEATSALDNRTQATVTESLRQLKVTTILVAHRLSTIRHADRIYVIEAGRVVQNGKFEELARQEGLFARLMARQTM
jgi:ABC-type bacteriocin/lantibiotic exporter with double-glycine peptidase domain